MNKRYYCAFYYTLLPLFILPILAAVELGIANKQARYEDIIITAALLIVVYLSLRFDHCLITNKNFSRISYFFWKKTLKVNEITEITFPSTWIATPEARTLVVWDRSGKKITMTDMAYTRPVLADVVRTLLNANPHIRLDDHAHALLQTWKSSSSK